MSVLWLAKRARLILVLAVLMLIIGVSLYLSNGYENPGPTSTSSTISVAEPTTSASASTSSELGVGSNVEVYAVDQQGTQLIAPVTVNGTLDGYTPQFVSVSGNASVSVSCSPLAGFSSVSTGPFEVTAGQVVSCAYGLATSVSTNGNVTLIINTYEPGYGPYSYGQIQITTLQGQIIQSGVTGAMGTGSFTVPAQTVIQVVWLGMGGVQDPAAQQELTTGTTTPEVLTLSGNPAQGNNPCMMMNENAC